jgi:hypothetical protein
LNQAKPVLKAKIIIVDLQLTLINNSPMMRKDQESKQNSADKDDLSILM